MHVYTDILGDYFDTGYCKDHALSCGRPRKIMKGGGGLSWGVMDVGTSRHGRRDTGAEFQIYLTRSVSS